MVLGPIHLKHRIRQWGVPIVGLWLVGCGAIQTYPGPALPSDQVAVLEIGNVVLYALDGEPVNLGHQRKLQMLPGEHLLRASHNMSGYPEQVITYTFTAEPGHAYRFDADYKIERTLAWRPWIQDAADGKIVGGWK